MYFVLQGREALSRINWKKFCIGATSISLLLSVLACSSPMQCSDQIDGGSLLDNLQKTNDPSKLSGDLALLANQCTLTENKISAVNVQIERFIKLASGALQAEFYKSILGGNALVKSEFVKRSPIFTIEKNNEKFKIVKAYQQLGKGIDVSDLTNKERETFNQNHPNVREAGAIENFRVIKVGPYGVRRLFEFVENMSAHGSSTSMAMYDLETGKLLTYVDPLSGDSASAGTGYHTKEVGFLVGDKSGLQYVYAINADGNYGGFNDAGEAQLSDCTSGNEISFFDGFDLKSISLKRNINVSCDKINELTFEAIPEEKIISDVEKLASRRDFSGYVNFKTMDIADNDLVNLTINNNQLGLINLLIKLRSEVPRVASSEKFRSYDEMIESDPKYVVNYLSATTTYMDQVNWLLKDKEKNDAYEEFKNSSSTILSAVASINKNHQEIESSKYEIEQAKSEVENNKRISATLVRELSAQKDGFQPSRNRQFGYIAVLDGYNPNPYKNAIIVYSDKNLFNGRPYITFIGKKDDQKVNMMVGDFSVDLNQYDVVDVDLKNYNEMIKTTGSLKKQVFNELHSIEDKLSQQTSMLIRERFKMIEDSSSIK